MSPLIAPRFSSLPHGNPQESLIEKLKRQARTNPYNTAKNIQNSGVESQDDLIEIAKICAEQSGQVSVDFFENFGIKDESKRIELARIYFKNSFHETIRHFPKFHITTQSVIIEFVKKSIQGDSRYTCERIGEFGLSQSHLMEMLEFAFEKNQFHTILSLNHFVINDQSFLNAFALKCAQTQPYATAKYIKNFRIKSEEVRKTLVTACYAGAPGETLQNYKGFAISDQGFIIEFAKMSAEKNALLTGKNVKELRIASDSLRFELFIECAHRINGREFIEYFFPFPQNLTAILRLMYRLMVDYEKSIKKLDRDTIDYLLKEMIEKITCTTEAKEILEALGSSLLDSLQENHQEAFLWFLDFLTRMTHADREAVEWIFGTGLWKELAELNVPLLRLHLTPWLFSLAGNKVQRDLWNDFLSSTSSRKGIRLLSLSFHALNEAGIPFEAIDQALKDITSTRKARDVIHIPLLVQIPLMLATASFLSPDQKRAAFPKIFPEMPRPSLVENPQHKGQGTRRKQVKGNLFRKPWEEKLFKGLISVKLLLQQQETEWIGSQDDISVFFHKMFEKMIPLKGLQSDAGSAYANTFTKSRHPEGLLTYASGLKTLNNPALLESLGKYVVSVFDGTFQEMRYETPNNPHLAKIFGARPDLKEIWQKEIHFNEAVDLSSSSTNAFNAKEWINSQLVDFGHLGKEDISYVRTFLHAGTEEEKSSIVSNLTNEILELKEPKKLLNRKLQKACISIAITGSVNNLPSLEPHFREIQEFLPQLTEPTEFHSDISGMLNAIATLKRVAQEIPVFHAMITDDPFDLLYCGSEVHGSCQRLDGIPANNKGLLGYLNDGKILLLALKNRTGRIIARAMLKLLWDGEQPVLFREKFYPNTASSNEMKALDQLAIRAAKQMSVPLTSCGGDGELYGKDLQSIGGSAPCEYSDAAIVNSIGGIYSIDASKIRILRA